MNRLSADLKRLQESLTDAARISSREIKRSVDLAKRQLERVQLVNQRKDLLAELGRTLYEAHGDGLPPLVADYVNETELAEIIGEIKAIDGKLAQKQQKQ